jgi:hypothetical protein
LQHPRGDTQGREISEMIRHVTKWFRITSLFRKTDPNSTSHSLGTLSSGSDTSCTCVTFALTWGMSFLSSESHPGDKTFLHSFTFVLLLPICDRVLSHCHHQDERPRSYAKLFDQRVSSCNIQSVIHKTSPTTSAFHPPYNLRPSVCEESDSTATISRVLAPSPW